MTSPLGRCRIALLVSLVVLAAPAAHALPIAIAEQQRSVAADASASAAGANDADTATDASALPGPASLDAAALAVVEGASGTAGASQQSDVSALLLAGEGTASVDVQAPAADAFALASADTQARIVFTASADSALRLAGRIAASGDGAGDASALLEVAAVDSTLDPLLLLFEVGPGEELDIDSIAMLHAGIEYRILAVARANGDALGGEQTLFSSTFRFTLTEVPEPGTAFLLALGLALLRTRRAPLPA